MKNAPHDLNTEQEVLGSVFLDDKLMEDIIDQVKAADFYDDFHKSIYKAMAYLHYQYEGIGYQEIIDRLEYNKVIDSKNMNSVEYILQLSETAPSTANFQKKVERLLDLSQKRRLYELGEWLVDKGIEGVSTENVLKKIEGTIDDINTTSNQEVTSIKEYAEEWLQDFESGEKINNIMFGFKMLDEHIMLEPSNFGVIAARPSVGKSAYALNIAKNFSLQNQYTLFISLEMSRKEVMNRLIANMARVKHEDIKKKQVTGEHDKKKVREAMNKIKHLPLYIYDSGNLDVGHLLNLAKKLKKQGKLDVLLVDYLHLMESGKNNLSPEQNVAYISRKIKQLAQDLSIPCIALSQLNRRSVTQGDKPKPPDLHDLRQSGAIEQDANWVLMLHTPDEAGKFEEEKFIDFYVRKNRSGKIGTWKGSYYGDYVEFVEKEYVNGRFETVVQKKLDGDDGVLDDDLPF